MKYPFALLMFMFFIAFFGTAWLARPVFAEGEHGDPAKPEKKMEMHHHAPSSKSESSLPPGTEEVKIDLSGAFCHRHPEEIAEGLMKLAGILHVEAFSGRKYILVHYDGGTAVTAEEMAAVVSGLKGSGWRCKGTVSTKRRTER